MNGREKLLNRKRFWFDLVQEEFKRNNKAGKSSKVEDEENFSMVGKGRKEKERRPRENLNIVKIME